MLNGKEIERRLGSWDGGEGSVPMLLCSSPRMQTPSVGYAQQPRVEAGWVGRVFGEPCWVTLGTTLPLPILGSCL